MRQAILQNPQYDDSIAHEPNIGIPVWLGKLGRTLLNLKEKLNHKDNHRSTSSNEVSFFSYKYVRFKYGVIVFPPNIQHRQMSDACSNLGEPLSGGFVTKNEDGIIECHGESISLRLGARPDDTRVLNEHLSKKIRD